MHLNHKSVQLIGDIPDVARASFFKGTGAGSTQSKHTVYSKQIKIQLFRMFNTVILTVLAHLVHLYYVQYHLESHPLQYVHMSTLAAW